MKKQFLYISILCSFMRVAAQPSHEEFLKLDEGMRVGVVKALAVKMAEQLPDYFDRFIQDAVSAADLEQSQDSNGGPYAVTGNGARDFKRHLFSSIATTIMDDTVVLFDSRNCLMSKALAIKERKLEEVFTHQFVEKMAKGCKKDEQDYVWRYFGCAFFV